MSDTPSSTNLTPPSLQKWPDGRFAFRFELQIPRDMLVEALKRQGVETADLQWSVDGSPLYKTCLPHDPRPNPYSVLRSLRNAVEESVESIAPSVIQWTGDRGHDRVSFDIIDRDLPGIVAHMARKYRAKGVLVENGKNVTLEEIQHSPEPANVPLALTDYASFQDALDGALRLGLGFGSVATAPAAKGILRR